MDSVIFKPGREWHTTQLAELNNMSTASTWFLAQLDGGGAMKPLQQTLALLEQSDKLREAGFSLRIPADVRMRLAMN